MLGIINAPSNLGLRPPEPRAVPGTGKAPEALREAGLHTHLLRHGAVDLGTVIAGRYRDDLIIGSGRVRNQEALLDHTQRLAERISSAWEAKATPFVIGGDCSILVAAALAARRRGHFGLVHLDGHTDFRHPGNSHEYGAVGGEDLAAVVGLHTAAISNIDQLSPYIRPDHAVHIGHRAKDDEQEEVRATIGAVFSASEVRAGDAAAIGREAAARASRGTSGYWVHLDVDILDPDYLTAVDCPDPGGLNPDELVALLRELLPQAVGFQVAIFDPDLDPTGVQATALVSLLIAALTPPE